MSNNFKTINSSDLKMLSNEFVELKRATGLKYFSEEKVSKYFTRYCEENYPNENLPEDIINRWLISNPNQSLKTKNNKNCALKVFAQYLFSLGYEPLRIPLVRYTRSTAFIPHIFTVSEMEAIWKTVDNIKPTRICPNLYRTLPVLFRLLYASGLRIGEALNLNGEDFDFSNNLIIIKESKSQLERLIPMSESLSNVLKKYAEESFPKIGAKEPFFYYRNGTRLDPSTVYSRFRIALKGSKIPYQGPTRGPRLHDLRHTFSVNAMNKLVDDGKDLYVILPVLSAYLGHINIKSTESYIRLTVDRLSTITDKVSEIIPNIFPEVEPNAEI